MRQFAEQEAIERTAVGYIGNAADSQFFALSKSAWKPDCRHQFTSGPSNRAVFAIATEVFDESPGPLSDRQVSINFLRQRIETCANPQFERFRCVQLEAFSNNMKLANKVGRSQAACLRIQFGITQRLAHPVQYRACVDESFDL